MFDTQQSNPNQESNITNISFNHKTFEERLKEYGGEISVFAFEWGEPVGKELL
jgi:hypothetical protein